LPDEEHSSRAEIANAGSDTWSHLLRRSTMKQSRLGVIHHWVSKAVAGRKKDRQFCRTLLAHGIVDPDVLRGRLAEVPDVDERVSVVASGWIR